MKTKNLVSVAALVSFLCASHSVRAGGLPTTTSATLKGTVRFEGKLPKPKSIMMTADPTCARQHPGPVLVQDVMTDAKGDLQNVVVFISDGLGDRKFEVPSQPAVIEQKGCMYLPHVVAMQANQPLHLVNDDATSHNVHPTPANNREWDKAEPPGTSVDDTFAREEIAIPVKCNVHPWMHGYIAVFKHPYFTVTGKDGSFDLSGLPPGTYTIKAWHETLGTSTQTVTIGEKETKEIGFVFKGL